MHSTTSHFSVNDPFCFKSGFSWKTDVGPSVNWVPTFEFFFLIQLLTSCGIVHWSVRISQHGYVCCKRKDLCSNKVLKLTEWMCFCPLPDRMKIKLLIPDLERRVRRMYSSLKVIWVAFEKCNPVCLILFLKGHSTYCPNIIIKIFHLGLGQQFIRPSLCPCRNAPALWKT